MQKNANNSTNPALDEKTVKPNCVGCGGGNPIDSFKNSSDFSWFSSLNQTLVAKINYNAAQVRNDINQLYGSTLESIHLPVIEDNGDTSGIVIGYPYPASGTTKYLIIYQDNYNLVRDANGNYYGQIQADLFNTNISYSAHINSSFQVETDSLVSGPLWINNPEGEDLRTLWVWPSSNCMDATRDHFFATCGCRLICTIDDVVGFGSCSLGTYAGAALWCARHNNSPQ
ncbi:MAG TPA: hypothetical protein VFM31_01515 [Nitrososphaeraceae archaeon]|nr:hypothetical protein [Nitrososphaeraceae archaeon]